MRHDLVIAGVGGQGILSVAKVLSIAAVRKGLNVKQAEVHGMSQRGGAVYSHLRMSDAEIFSDLIPLGKADMVLAVEPMESLRYTQMLKADGAIVASTNAVANITNYPAIESVLDHVTAFKRHISIDMEKLARAAGSPLAANVVALGAASLYLAFTARELEEAIETLFSAKGARVIEVNLRAFRFGRTAGAAYMRAMQKGAQAASVRSWIESLSAEHLADEDALQFAAPDADEVAQRLSGAEAHAFESLLWEVHLDGRKQIYEHEVYTLVELVGAISPPRHTFVPKGSMIAPEVLEQYPGDRVVLKLVSPEVVHKSEAKAVVFVPKRLDAVRTEIDRLVARHTQSVSVAGVLVVEFIEHGGGMGSELFVGIRSTREFGPVIAAGLGGTETEYLASKMRPGLAVAKAAADDIDAEGFLELFKQTVAYDFLAGSVRGQERQVSDAELLRCFRAFIAIARRFCVDRGAVGPDIGELEVNPFAFRDQHLVPLDGRGCLRTASKAAPPRPTDKMAALLEPKAMALVGVSSKPGSFGRIILGNVLAAGFDRSRLFVVKKDETEIDGITCVPSIFELPETVDLLVIAAPAKAVPEIIEQANASGKVRSGIVISGGAGEAEGSEALGEEIRAAIARGRAADCGGAVFLGPNCMGVQSRPGKYDTFFIPSDKLPPRKAPPQPVAIVSQSGAFIVSRLSALADLNPMYAISIGNQADVTVSDLLWALEKQPQLKVAGVYLEGFADLDGMESLRAVSALTRAGKTVVFYKAGRTEVGRSAAAGHTAAVAGDYDICLTAMRHAGALVAEGFREFSELLETATLLADRPLAGLRLFAVSNAGMEAVGMADALTSAEDGLRFEPPSDCLSGALKAALDAHGLAGLVTPRNPLDVTPMAGEAAYDAVVRAALSCEEADVVIVSCVPLAPQLKTLESEIGAKDAFPALAEGWLQASTKPMAFVVDGGTEYEALARAIRGKGMPVFHSADEAVLRLEAWASARPSPSPNVPEPSGRG